MSSIYRMLDTELKSYSTLVELFDPDCRLSVVKKCRLDMTLQQREKWGLVTIPSCPGKQLDSITLYCMDSKRKLDKVKKYVREWKESQLSREVIKDSEYKNGVIYRVEREMMDGMYGKFAPSFYY